MAYATQADVVNAIGEPMLATISDHSSTGTGTVDPAVVTVALDDASSFADSYLDDFLPISPVPAMLRRCVVIIAVQFMRLVGTGQSTDDSTKAYTEAVKWLERVRDGEISLGLPGVPAPSIGAPEVVSEPRLWTRQTAGGLF